jgi:hypothetical protein
MAMGWRQAGQRIFRGLALAFLLTAGCPSLKAASDSAPRAAAQLEQAEALRLTDNAAFVRLLRAMDAGQAAMTAAQR